MPRVPGAGSIHARGKGHVNEDEDGEKQSRVTAEQVATLEYLYQESTKPCLSERQDMIRKYSALATMDSNQIKTWFQNRRSRDKRKRQSTDLQEVNKQLLGANQLLEQENDRLQKVVRRLVLENECMRHQKENAAASTTGSNVDSTVNSHQLHPEVYTTSTSMHFLAERTLTEFLSKANGSDVDWVQIPGMKTGSDTVQFVSILHNCSGAAARACCHVPLDPAEVMKILKDPSSWFGDCRKMKSYANFPTNRKGTIELIYMQLYALTTLTSARDLWTLRYTAALEDGSLVVCQRSTSGSDAVPSSPAANEFQRAKILASGYLIQPCADGGSIITIVDHFDFEEASSITEVLQPRCMSSKLVAQRMTIAALHHILQEAKDRSSKLTHSIGPFMKPAVMRSLSRRLSRVFNDAINGFTDDAWLQIYHNPADNLIVSTKTTKNFSTNGDCSNALPLSEGILCVKASMLLQHVSPMLLVQFLKEHRSDWWEFNVDAYSAESVNYGSLAFPGLNTHFSEDGVQLGNARSEDEMLEVIRLKGQTQAMPPRDLFLLQISNGLGEFTVGACSELLFAPIDKNPSDDPLLLSSGFRILSLESNTGIINGQAQQTMNLASCSAGPSSSSRACSLLIVAFQFPYESHRLDYVANMAQKYVGNVLSYVRNFENTVTPSRFNPRVEPELTPGSPAIIILASDICQSYRLKFGEELLGLGTLSGEAVLENLWYHQDAIFCWSFKPVSVCLFANQAGYNMLDASKVNLRDIKPDQIFDKSLQDGLRTVMQQGYAILSGGTCMSLRGVSVTYDRVVLWTVEEVAGPPKRLAFAFSNWSQVIHYG